MASPFAVFRRNQKVMTVILTCLAMFAFIILQSLEQMSSSAIIPVVFGLAGAGLAWMWGSQNERGISYPTIGTGAVLGAIAGAMLVSQAGNQGGVTTAHGRLSRQELGEMKERRNMANQFVAGAFRERKENASASRVDRYLFGQTSTRDVVIKQLLAHEADQLGIEISDEYITNYIKEVSENKITRKKLTELRGEIGLGESELYDILRAELRAQVAYRVLNPELVHMPDQYWSDFEKLNVNHSIDAVAIPVEPFAARLPRPSDAEIKEIFEAFKGVYPMGENPGFVQPDRLKLAWFESDYEAAEALVGEIPEDELKARYEERKDIEYKIETLPDLGAGFDDGAPKFGEPPAPVKTTPPAGDAEAAEDAAKPDDAAKSDDSESIPAAKTDGDAPAETPKSDDPPSKEEKATDDSSAAEPKEEECGDGEEQDADTETEEAGKEEQPEAETEEKSAVDSETVEEKKPTEETPADPDAAPKDATENDATEEAPTPDLSEIKYRSFEEVRDEIRDLMLREKTEEQIESQIAAAIAAVKNWRFKFREANPEEVEDAPNAATDSVEYQEYLDQVKKDHDQYNADLAAGIATKAEVYAKENGLKFVSTVEFLSQQELIEHDEYRLGSAREPFDPSNFMNQTQPQSAAARLFTGATTLFIPEEAQGQFDDTRYAFWATGENEQHVPTLDEPGVREQVEKAARMKTARTEAEARAKQLAESLAAKFAESSIVSMADGIADQSIFGEKASAAAEAEGDSSTEPAAAKDGAEASDGLEKEESCGDEQGDETVPAETESKGSKPAAAETSSEEATSDEITDEPLSVIFSPPFTWYRQPQGRQMNQFAQPTIEFGFVLGIDGVDDNFMKSVSETPVGDVVVIPNVTKQIYFVVYVKARHPSGDADPSLAPVRQQFIDGVDAFPGDAFPGMNWKVPIPMSPIYERLANSQASEIHQVWLAEFFAKHNVSVEELDAI
jgi:hypothetical protein